MPWSVAAAAIGTAGAVHQGNAAEDAAEASADGARAAGQLSQRQFAQTRGDLRPYRKAGEQAQGILSRVHALGGGVPDYSAFEESPGYNFRLEQGEKALERAGAARGMTLSGAQLKRLSEYNQGMASQEFGNWYDRISRLAAGGQNAAVQTGQFGANAAGQTGMAYQNAGNATATGIIDKSNAYSQGLGSIAGAMGQMSGPRQSGYRAAQAGPKPLESIYRGASLNSGGLPGRFYGPLARGGV